ncbi:MAG: hypothetical protein H0W72_01005 [Planctomycetes bacterium]|nr:hypothetical protein [Planctomycetota bacterium]
MTKAPIPFADAAGRPLTRGGLGFPICWFSGGRTACAIADHGGVEEIVFFGLQPAHHQCFFRAGNRSAYARLFRAQVLVDDRPYTLEFTSGRLHPSGWTGTMTIPGEGVELTVAMICTNQGLTQAVRALRNPRRRRLGLRLMLRDYVRVEMPGRTWSPWTMTAKSANCSVEDVPAPRQPGGDAENAVVYPDHGRTCTTLISVVGDGGVSMRTWRSQLRSFTAGGGGRDGVGISLVFATDAAGLRAERKRLNGGIAAAAWATVAEWAATERSAPQPEGLPPLLASFAKQAPALLRAAMPADLPGALRSSYNSYWVWGWDTLVMAHTDSLISGPRRVGEILDLMARHAHPAHGFGHAFDGQMRVTLTQALPAQGLFAVAAWGQWAVAGDLAPAQRHWPLLVAWLRRSLALPARDGLIPGIAMFPDHPQDVGQTGDDLSTFNNAIFFQACRCIEHLAGALDDAATATAAADAAEACRLGFRRRLWDAKRGFWCDSLDATSLRRRPSYPAHAIIWVTPFARELVGDAEAAADFMERNHRCAGGLRMYPSWDPAFNADGNQLGQHYPPGQDPLYVRLMATTGRQQRLREWLAWVETYWSSLTVPEGCTLDAQNDGPQRPDLPGGRQMFSVKAWYDVLIGAILGIGCDPSGLTVEPGLDGPLAWRGLPLHGRRWTIDVTGRGPHLARVVVAGTPWTGTHKVPLPGRGPATIVIRRSAKAPRHCVLRSADGAEVLASGIARGCLKIRLRSQCRVLVRLWSPSRPHVEVDGAAAAFAWDAAGGIADVWLPAGAQDRTVSARPG